MWLQFEVSNHQSQTQKKKKIQPAIENQAQPVYFDHIFNAFPPLYLSPLSNQPYYPQANLDTYVPRYFFPNILQQIKATTDRHTQTTAVAACLWWFDMVVVGTYRMWVPRVLTGWMDVELHKVRFLLSISGSSFEKLISATNGG